MQLFDQCKSDRVKIVQVRESQWCLIINSQKKLKSVISIQIDVLNEYSILKNCTVKIQIN